MTRPRILLVNPPIYDFAAYDFWLRPYGLLSVAGQVRGQADMVLFDHLDRLHPLIATKIGLESDLWGRGCFYRERIEKPEPLRHIRRHYNRFGLPADCFRTFLAERGPFDYVLVQTMMTYWYTGVQEVVRSVRDAWPKARIVLGGHYVTVCPEHAGTLGADLLIAGTEMEPLWAFLGLTAEAGRPALWEAYDRLQVGALKLSEGCPFQCSYCSVPTVYGRFRPRSLERSLADLALLVSCGATDVAFYDDALLFNAEEVLVPFLDEVIRQGWAVNFHSPNALNARFVTGDLAKLMVRAGFKTFYLGFESHCRQWQEGTGGKVYSEELARAVELLVRVGVEPTNITAYQIVGHPDSQVQELEESMRFVHSLGIRGTLADFSPIPGTVDGQACSRWVDMDEPLMHNKTAFPIIRLGFDEVNRLKDIQRKLNHQLGD